RRRDPALSGDRECAGRVGGERRRSVSAGKAVAAGVGDAAGIQGDEGQGRQRRAHGVGARSSRGPDGRWRPEGRRGPVGDRIRLRDLQRLRGIRGDEKERKDPKESNGADHEDLLTGRSLFRPAYISVGNRTSRPVPSRTPRLPLPLTKFASLDRTPGEPDFL